MKLVVLGLSLSSSWGNGHATTYRALLKALAKRGHDVLFLERDVPWYRDNRDIADPEYCRLEFYGSLEELDHWRGDIRGNRAHSSWPLRLRSTWSSAATYCSIAGRWRCILRLPF